MSAAPSDERPSEEPAAPPRWLGEPSDDDRERPPITRRRIVEAALRLVDEHGLSALTFRRLATELGASPMSAYAHVRNKDELLDLMLDHVLGEIDLRPTASDWVAQLRAMFRSYHKVLLAHPGIARIYSDSVKIGPNGLRAIERTMAVLREAGFSPASAANAFFALFTYTIGFHQIGRVNPLEPPSGGGRGARASRAVTTYFSALPPTEVPTVVALAPYFSGTKGRRRYEFGLDVLLAGLEAKMSAEAQGAS
ncbi:MAG: TetR/AcrR family transcriptional regulator [Actinobacteria bacterium]|nr:TetR/AcrR family transcriptional regulator [Actinomycetota bacterium]